MLADKYFVNTTLYSSSAGRYLYTVPLIWDNIIRHTFFKDIIHVSELPAAVGINSELISAFRSIA